MSTSYKIDNFAIQFTFTTTGESITVKYRAIKISQRRSKVVSSNTRSTVNT